MKYPLLLIVCTIVLWAHESKAQTVAKIKVGASQSSPSKVERLENKLQSINTAIQQLIKGQNSDPLQTTILRLDEIQQLMSDTLFMDMTSIQNFNPQIAAVDTIKPANLKGQESPLTPIAWTTLTTFDTAKAVNQLINSYKSTKDPSSLSKIQQLLHGDKNLSQFPVVKTISSTITSVLKLPLSDTSFKVALDTIPIKGLVIVVDTAKTSAVSTTPSQCIKLDSIASLKVDKQADGSTLCSLLDAKDNPLTKFTIIQFNEQLFYDALSKAIFGLCTASLSPTDSTAGNNLIAQFKNQKLYQALLEATIATTNSQDLAGKLSIYKHGWIYSDVDKDSTAFIVYSTQLQFQDGFIENIKIMGKKTGENNLLKFENSLPIAFTTKREFARFDNVRLYERTYHKGNYLRLGDAISYSENFELDNKDYCPQNQVYTNDKVSDSVTEVNLYKEQTSQILQARIFTDLKGFSDNNPNGLVQLELSKKLNLWSNRMPISKKSTAADVGWLNYLTPLFSLNKIESNQKNLTLNVLNTVPSVNDPNKPLVFTSTTNLLSHQQFKVGADLSVFLLDLPGIKSDINFGISGYFGSTPIQDTLRTGVDTLGHHVFIPSASNNVLTYNISSFQWGPYLTYRIYPNPRFGFMFTYSLFNFASLSNRFVQVRDSANFVNYVNTPGNNIARYPYSHQFKGGWVSVAEIFAYYTPSTNSQLFFRYRLYEDINYKKENFRQIQLGVTTYLTTTKQSKNGKSHDAPVTTN